MEQGSRDEAEMGGEVPTTLALTADLMFASRIQGAARSVGVPVRIVRTVQELWEAARDVPVRLILLDLEARRVDVHGLIRRLRADPATAEVPVVVFGPHVRGEALRAAREAGADRVLARSAFVRQLPRLLKEGSVADGPRS